MVWPPRRLRTIWVPALLTVTENQPSESAGRRADLAQFYSFCGPIREPFKGCGRHPRELFCEGYGSHRDMHSSPTRPDSDPVSGGLVASGPGEIGLRCREDCAEDPDDAA